MAPTKTKAEANYQNSPKGSEQCSKCSMFRKPNDCTLVKGYILPQGWCEHFDRR